jgi:hypothetical protein
MVSTAAGFRTNAWEGFCPSLPLTEPYASFSTTPVERRAECAFLPSSFRGAGLKKPGKGSVRGRARRPEGQP